jgi:hypothetical protein
VIKDKLIAEGVSKLMLEFGGRLDDSIATVRHGCSDAEFRAYRLAVGKVLGEMLLEIMNPIYREHPDLKPIGLD